MTNKLYIFEACCHKTLPFNHLSMKKNLRPILGILVFVIIFYFMHTGRSFITIISAVYAPMVFIFYMHRTTELRKNLSDELFKKKRRRIQLFLTLLTWMFMSIITIVERLDSHKQVEWVKVLILGLGYAVIMYIFLHVYEYFLRRLSARVVK